VAEREKPQRHCWGQISSSNLVTPIDVADHRGRLKCWENGLGRRRGRLQRPPPARDHRGRRIKPQENARFAAIIHSDAGAARREVNVVVYPAADEARASGEVIVEY
jgi:hypothetical protein